MNFKEIKQDFATWLKVLNYSQSTQIQTKHQIEAFFSYLENQSIYETEAIEHHGDQFLVLQSQRKHKKKATVLSQNYLKIYVRSLKLLGCYLREIEEDTFSIHFQTEKHHKTLPKVLTIKQIENLYQATDDSILGFRDRAMLAVYYGCGLRKTEGISLKISDIDLEKSLILVRKGKGYKERYVPLSRGVKEDLKNYILVGRNHASIENLFISSRTSQAIHPEQMNSRLRTLLKMSQISETYSLHSLRHSIATHLLEKGMPIEQISRFLGHSSLESTLIYVV